MLGEYFRFVILAREIGCLRGTGKRNKEKSSLGSGRKEEIVGSMRDE